MEPILLYLLIFSVILFIFSFRNNYRWYRKLMGGIWYEHLDNPWISQWEWNRNIFGAKYKEQWIDGKRTYVKIPKKV